MLARAQTARSRRWGHFNQLHSKKRRGSRTPRQNPDSGLKAGAEASCAPDHVWPTAAENTNKNISRLLYVTYPLAPRNNLRIPPPRSSTALARILSLPGPEPGRLAQARPDSPPSSPEQLPRALVPLSFSLSPSVILTTSPPH